MTALGMDVLLKYSDTSSDGTRFGFLGDDGEMAYAIGHDVTDEAFAMALSRDGFDADAEDFSDFERGYLFITELREDCGHENHECDDDDESCDDEDHYGCYCDDYGWWGAFSETFSPGGIAVTWWRA